MTAKRGAEIILSARRAHPGQGTGVSHSIIGRNSVKGPHSMQLNS